MKLEKTLLIIKIIALLTIGPIAVIGNLGVDIRGGLWNCPFPIPFIMCNVCPVFCTFGQIRSWLFYSILGSNLLMGRVFCGLFCPGGIIQDLLFKIPIKKITIPQSTDLMLRYMKYGVAILVIGLVAHATNLWAGLPLMDKLWSFLVTYSVEARIARIGAAVMVLMLAVFMPRSWCRYLCPLGAWISVFNKYSLLRITRNPEKCVACHLCYQRCPGGLDVLGSQQVRDSLECVRCLQCYTGCKANAMELHWRRWRNG